MSEWFDLRISLVIPHPAPLVRRQRGIGSTRLALEVATFRLPKVSARAACAQSQNDGGESFGSKRQRSEFVCVASVDFNRPCYADIPGRRTQPGVSTFPKRAVNLVPGNNAGAGGGMTDNSPAFVSNQHTTLPVVRDSATATTIVRMFVCSDPAARQRVASVDDAAGTPLAMGSA